jgi:hypothetical protein
MMVVVVVVVVVIIVVVVVSCLPEEGKRRHENPKSTWPLFEPKFDICDSEIQSSVANHQTAMIFFSL